MADKKLTPDQILDEYIPKYESGDQNIPNYMYDETHTAQGPWQITNQNWRSIGPKVGIDTSKFPNAMSAERGEQRKVAEYMLNYTPQGIRNWTDYNPKLKAALEGYEVGDKVPQQQDITQLSDEEFNKQLAAAGLPPLPTKIKTVDKKGEVKAPPKSIYQSTPPGPSGIYNRIRDISQSAASGYRDFARGFGSDESAPARAADIESGAMKTVVPAALSVLPGAGELSIPRALLAAGAGYGGKKLLGWGGEEAGSKLSHGDPDWTRFGRETGEDVGELGGGILGYKGPDIPFKLPGNMGVRAEGLLKTVAPGLGTRFQGAREVLTGQRGGGKTAEGKVESPPPGMKPPTPEKIQEMLKRGSISVDRADELLKGDKLSAQELANDVLNQHHEEAFEEYKSHQQKQADQVRADAQKQADIQRTAQEKQADINRRAAEKAADIKRKADEKAAENAFKLVQTGEGGPSLHPSGMSGGTPVMPPVKVTLPSSNVTVSSPPPTGPVNPPTGSQGLGPTGISQPIGTQTMGGPQPTAPVAPPPTAAPQATIPFGPKVEGTPGAPISGTATMSPQLPAITTFDPAQPRPAISANVPERTPPVLPKPAPSPQQKAISIADYYAKQGKLPPVTLNEKAAAKLANEVGFKTDSDMRLKAREIAKGRERSKQPTPENP